MSLFRKNNEKEEVKVIEKIPRKVTDLKPWGKKERLIVLIALLITVGSSGFLALTARKFKLPNLPKITPPNLRELNPFKEQVIVIGNPKEKISQEKIENIKKMFKEVTAGHSGIYAFYIYDLNGDYFYGVNYQETMQAASLIKLPVMYLGFKENVDTNLLEAMGKRSDNNAFIKTVSILGKENINKTIIDLGMAKTSLSENTTTPEEIGIFFKKLYKNELLDTKTSQTFENYLTDTIFENWLRPGIPDEITLINKYGREAHVVNDAGIIKSDKPFVMVIMTDGVIEKEADELLPKLAKLLYTEHTANNK